MASKEQIQKSLDSLYERYGKTLKLLADSIDKIDSQEQRIKELEQQMTIEPSVDVDLTIPQSILDLEKSVLGNEE